MFDFLSNRLTNSLKKIKAKSTLTEEQVEETLREVRIALLESDVNFLVVKDFIASLKGKLVGSQLSVGLNPYQEVIKLMHAELVTILAPEKDNSLKLKFKPSILLMCGLQGSGKTTTCAKIAKKLTKENKKVLLVACDIYRPAAVEQLKILATQNQLDFYFLENKNPVEIANAAFKHAQLEGYDVVILDTAGRLAIDEALMKELSDIKKALNPVEILLTIDAMSGQDVINVAKTFNEKLELTGFVLTKLDSDAKAGASFSVSYLIKKPIKFITTGEKADAIDYFYPDRMADRMLGLGDVLSVIEKIQENVDQNSQEKLMHRMMMGKFDLNDLLAQMEQMKKFGKLKNLVKMMPGMSQKINDAQFENAEQKLFITKIILSSMTKQERKNPKLLNSNTRKARILKGSGRSSQEFNSLLKNFENMKVQIANYSKMLGKGKFGF